MFLAVGKGIDRQGARHVEREDARVGMPLTWAMFSQGRRVVASRVDGGYLLWLELAVSCFLLCRASELWAYVDGQVHPDFCLNAERPHFPSRRNTNCIQGQIGRLGIAGTPFGVEGWPKESGAHHHAAAVGGERVSRVNRTRGTPCCDF